MAWYEVFSQFGKKEVVPELVRDKEQSFVPIDLNDAILTNASGGYLQTALGFDQNSTTEVQKIQSWRALAQCPEIAWAVNEVCNDAVILDYDSYPCQLTIDDESTLPDKVKQLLSQEFRHVLKVMNFKRNGLEMFRQWYVDGRVYYHGVLDPEDQKRGLVAVRWIDPRNMKRVVEVEEKTAPTGHKIQSVKEDYYIYSGSYGRNGTGTQGYGASAIGVNAAIRVNTECVAYASSGLFHENADGTSYSVSFLDSALKSYNILTALEQAMTIYRLARAPERRVFYVDVGNLPKDKADQYLANVMARFKRKLSFNSTTGQVTTENGEMGIMDDFWLPRKEGGRGTEVSTLQSGAAWSDMNDLEWFQKKVLRGLNIPFGRYQSEGMFSMGRSMEITREEVKFAKFISQLRSRYSQSLLQLLKIHVVAKNIMKIEDFEAIINEINVKWRTDAYWDELLFNEMWQTRLNLLQSFQGLTGKYVSHDWIQKNVLQQTDEEIETQRKQIEKEAGDKRLNPPSEDNEY